VQECCHSLNEQGAKNWSTSNHRYFPHGSVIARVARGQQEGLQYSRNNNVTQDNNVVKGE
jgi:hypothetical protein